MKYIILAVMFSIGHGITALMCFLFGFSLDVIDTGRRLTLIEETANLLTSVLWWPSYIIELGSMGPTGQWMLFCGNSLLWGVMLAGLCFFIRLYIKGVLKNRTEENRD